MYSKRERSPREPTFPQRRRTPSFSSTLLDAIYRSIDESNADEEATLCHYTETTLIKKQSTKSCSASVGEEKKKSSSSLRRALMIEDWVEKQSGVYGYGSASAHFNSASSSSDSSSGGVFSSSEAESSSRGKPRRSSGVSAASKRLTQSSSRPENCMQLEQRSFDSKQQKPKREGGFTKTKLKALKIYGELKKVKQPISPGGRITSFLNSIFNGNAKKVKMCSVGAMDDVTFERKSKSACSSAASFSRSCLSKTPSSRGNNFANAKKRSVRFYPVSIIVDEDSRPCGHKCIYEDDPSLMPMPSVQKIAKSSSLKEGLKSFLMEKESGVVTTATRDYLKSYKKKCAKEFALRDFDDDSEDGDEEEDALSCSSSDLFELDHLIGIGRYREELPVYETTSLKTNQAIANGFMF